MKSNALLFVVSSLAVLAPVIVSLPLLRQRRYEDSSLEMNSTINKCPVYRWNSKEDEKRMTFTGQVTGTDSFLLFHFKSEPRCTIIKIPPRGLTFRMFRVCSSSLIRKEEPTMCQNITTPHNCRNNSDVYNATSLREMSPEKPFMAVWKWKLEPYSCLRLEVNYTTESHDNILYFMNTIWSRRYRREEISPLGVIPEILIQSHNLSADVTLVFIHQPYHNYELVFKAIKYSNHKCRRKCSS